MFMDQGKALLLILVANSAPILVRQIAVLARLDYPIDFRYRFIDGNRWLGDSKTWRGLIAALLATMFCSFIIQTGWGTGLIVGALAMSGDCLSSFCKRRLAINPSGMALGLDQIPESLLPLLYLHHVWQLDWLDVWLLVVIFMLLELSLSRILFRLHIRKRPY
ncbi:MAG: CDP-archaeol synthase [Gammaproteobacteria bacterium]|nr:CDP-archaeol synthase [Gammaproteobacteria bacterium]